MTDEQAIAACIRACAASKDNRGRWRPANQCFIALERGGGDPEIALRTAMAAQNFGSWLRHAAEHATARAIA